MKKWLIAFLILVIPGISSALNPRVIIFHTKVAIIYLEILDTVKMETGYKEKRALKEVLKQAALFDYRLENDYETFEEINSVMAGDCKDFTLWALTKLLKFGYPRDQLGFAILGFKNAPGHMEPVILIKGKKVRIILQDGLLESPNFHILRSWEGSGKIVSVLGVNLTRGGGIGGEKTNLTEVYNKIFGR